KLTIFLQKTHAYADDLDQLGKRGGDIEQALKSILQDPSDQRKIYHLKLLITKSLEINLAFEQALQELLTQSGKVEVLKSELAIVEGYPDLAVVIGQKRGSGANVFIVLLNRKAYLQEREKMQWINKVMAEGTPEGKKAMEEFYKYCDSITDYTEGYGFFEPEKLSYFEAKLVDNAIIGYAELRYAPNRYQYLGAFEIWRIAAKKGFGPFFFELVFSFAAKEKKPVIIDRGEVSGDARKVWAYFDERPSIIKYPIALQKYPELIGFTRDEVIEKFGAGINASTFDNDGFPRGIAEEKRKELLAEIGSQRERTSKSYLDLEITRDTNIVTGPIASLDKAYYFDGKITIVNDLLNRGTALKCDRRMLENAGRAFFLRFKSQQSS
ncbi:hypothetical protein HY488_03160, partial [Candidatus Woesearchaeota archaeon]|nr:hypothetical protein [Candidatus Woesearchaeota archaeon]